MAARRRRRTYKFTEKRQSKLGIAALMLAIFSIFIFGLVVANSFMHDGNGSMYLGSAGVSSMLLAVIAFVMAIRSLMDENVFKLFPYLSTIVSFLAAGGWIMLYVIGF
jgi:hypothetical protein